MCGASCVHYNERLLLNGIGQDTTMNDLGDDEYMLPQPPVPTPRTKIKDVQYAQGNYLPCIVFFLLLVCALLVTQTAINPEDSSTKRIELSLGDKTCGSASNYFTPFEYGIHKCMAKKAYLHHTNTLRLELIAKHLPCELCSESETSCVPRHCIPRHLAVSYDSVSVLAAMMGAWCAQIKFPNDMRESFNLTYAASHIASEWTHALTRADVSSSLIMMTPFSQFNNTEETCDAGRQYMYQYKL